MLGVAVMVSLVLWAISTMGIELAWYMICSPIIIVMSSIVIAAAFPSIIDDQ